MERIAKISEEYTKEIYQYYLDNNCSSKEIVEKFNLNMDSRRVHHLFRRYGLKSRRELGYTILKYTEESEDSIKKQGVYKMYHLSDLDENIYIGACAKNKSVVHSSTGFIGRWKDHILKLKNKTHKSKKFQDIVNEHGLDGVRFSVVEFLEDGSDFDERERFWVSYYNSFERGVNTTSGGKVACKFSDSYLETVTGSKHHSSISVFQYDLSGNFIKEWGSIRLAAKTLGISEGGIQDAVRGERNNQAASFRWYPIYFGEKIDPSEKWKVDRKGRNVAKLDVVTRDVLQTYTTLVKASTDVNRLPCNIAFAANNGGTCGGYRWKFIDSSGEEI